MASQIPRPGQSNWAQKEAKYKQDIEGLTVSAEMATIEKEIAEEKLDNCLKELEELKEKLNQATLQITTLTDQQQESAHQAVNPGGNQSAVTVLQLQKVEEQNEVLKQALIRLRDISAKDKRDLEELQVQHEDMQEKLLDLEEREQKYLDQIKVYEEQIDVNQSAQEMVEKLSQKNNHLEDKLRELVEDLDGMEKLRDLNEQLLESAKENEIELTGELDKMRAQCVELNKRRRDVEDYMVSQERNLAKIKDENRQLSDQIVFLKNQFKEGETIEQQKHEIENVAYKLNFSESKMAEKEAEINRYKRNLAEVEEQMNNLSMITKEQSSRMDELRMQYEVKALENSELQRALKKKMEEVSELEIRREMVERKLLSTQKDSETKISTLNRLIETMKGVEVQHEEDMKRLMEDNELIERERRELRDQLNKSNRSLERSMQTGANVSMMTAQDTSLASLGISFQTTSSAQASPCKVNDVGPSSLKHHQQLQQQHQYQNIQISNQHNQSFTMQQHQQHQQQQHANVGTSVARTLWSVGPDMDESMLLCKIKDLSLAFERANRRNHELEVELALRELNKHTPPCVDSDSVRVHYDIDKAKSLWAEANKLKRQVRASIINQKICTKAHNINSHLRNERFDNAKLIVRYQALENEANALMSSSTLARMRPSAPLLHSTPVK